MVPAFFLPLLLSALPAPLLPPRDSEDRSRLTAEERVRLRAAMPDLPREGEYQYPHWAPRFAAWQKTLESAPMAREIDAVRPGRRESFDGREVPPERNVSGDPGVQSEVTIAVDPANRDHLVAASNDLSGAQRMYASRDGGVTWSSEQLRLGGAWFHTDPVVGFDSRGNAFTATISVASGGTSQRILVFRSTDAGRTWGEPAPVPTPSVPDKEWMAVDAQRGSPCRDFVYVAWDTVRAEPRHVLFSRSTDGGATFSEPVPLDARKGIGTTISVGPDGEVVVSWNALDFTVRQARSFDCGASFEPATDSAVLNQRYEAAVPSFCSRRALLYPVLDADRSTGCRRGRLYRALTDSPAGVICPNGSCTASQACETDVLTSFSTDGGVTWSEARTVAAGLPATDQFNPWLAVDPADGTVWLAWNDTRSDPTRATSQIHLSRSTDGGETWSESVPLSSAATDETAAGADRTNQYGDYNGLAVADGRVFATWTDRRDGAAEEAYVGHVVVEPDLCPAGGFAEGRSLSRPRSAPRKPAPPD